MCITRVMRTTFFARTARTIMLALASLAGAPGAPGAAGAQQRQPPTIRVYISADMEGVAGAVTSDQLGPAGFEYARFREYMTDEVNAAIQGARDAGATEFVISDSHGNGENLLLDRLPPDVTVVRSFPRPLMMMQGIDSTFDAAVFVGYHAATTNARGVRAHTLSSADLAAVRLNGVAMPESGINAAIAGAFGVPVVALSGDDAAVAEAQQLVAGLEGAVVKRAISFHAAATMMPPAAQALIREKVRAGVAARRAVRPYVVRAPIALDLTFKNYRPAELLAFLPSVERVDAHTVRFTARSMSEAARFMEFALSYRSDLTP